MKKQLTLILFIGILHSFYGQKKVEGHPIEHKIIKYQDFKENGFVVIPNKFKIWHKKPLLELHSYSNDLKLNWVTKIQCQSYKIQANQLSLVSSNNGKHTYLVELEGYNKKKWEYTLHQINKKGEVKSQTFEKNVSFGETNTVFSNNDYLFFLNTSRSRLKTIARESDNKFFNKEKLSFIRINHKNFETKKIILDMPKFLDENTYDYWKYLGHTENEIYIKRQIRNYDEIKNTFEIYVFNNKGEFIRNFNIILKNKHRYTQIATKKDYYNADVRHDNDYGWNKGSLWTNYGAEGQIIFNSENKTIYTFKVNSKNKLFVSKFDSLGREIFSNSTNFNTQEYKTFYRIHHIRETKSSYYFLGVSINKENGKLTISKRKKERFRNEEYLRKYNDIKLSRNEGSIIYNYKKMPKVEISFIKN